MTRDEAVAQVQVTLGFRSDLTSTIITTMKLAQQQLELEPNKPWFLLSENLTTTTVANERRLAVPEGFLEEHEDGALYYIDSNSKEHELRKDDRDVLMENFKDESPGIPKAYALRNGYFELFPVPDTTYTLEVLVYLADTVLSSNIENKWLQYAPLLLIGKTGNMLPTSILHVSAAAQFQTFEAQGRAALNNQNDARAEANTNPQMGGPH